MSTMVGSQPDLFSAYFQSLHNVDQIVHYGRDSRRAAPLLQQSYLYRPLELKGTRKRQMKQSMLMNHIECMVQIQGDIPSQVNIRK